MERSRIDEPEKKKSLFQNKDSNLKIFNLDNVTMSLSEKERILYNIHNKDKDKIGREGLQDVRPEDVLKTFNNSIDQSKRSFLIKDGIDDLGNLSPIRNMRERKNMLNEI